MRDYVLFPVDHSEDTEVGSVLALPLLDPIAYAFYHHKLLLPWRLNTVELWF